MPDEPSILAYVIWPKGARKIVDHIINKVGLSRGLDWEIFDMRKNVILRGDQLKSSYFDQTPGFNSDITTLENYDISSNE
jgi:hypothetical protein